MEMVPPKPTLQARNPGEIDKGDKEGNTLDGGERLCEFVLDFIFTYSLSSRLMTSTLTLHSSPPRTKANPCRYDTRESRGRCLRDASIVADYLVSACQACAQLVSANMYLLPPLANCLPVGTATSFI